MKALALALAAVLVPACSAQTKPSTSTRATKTPLARCRADLADAQKTRDEWADLNAQLKGRNDELEAKNKELQAQVADLTRTSAYRIGLLVILSKEIRGLPLNDLDKQVAGASATDNVSLIIATDIEKNVNEGVGIIKTLADRSNALVEKYNQLLAVAQNMQAQLNYANTRQQRFQNALALYSLMPKYAPPQTVNLQVTNCNLLPALCVH